MSKKTENAKDKRRTKVKDLPKKEKVMTAAEAKKVKGGGWLMSPAGHLKPPQQ
jgi:hypothetical protein